MSTENDSFEGIIVVAYPQEDKAKEMLTVINEAKKHKSFDFWDAAVIRKDEKGHYHHNETKDMTAPKGAGIGAVVGGLIGLPAGPAGVVLGAGLGAAVGGLVANTDSGINDDRLEDIGHALQSSNSALLIVSSHEYLQAMREYAGDEFLSNALQKLTSGISEQMLHGKNAAYILTSAGRSVSCHPLKDESIAELLGVDTPTA